MHYKVNSVFTTVLFLTECDSYLNRPVNHKVSQCVIVVVVRDLLLVTIVRPWIWCLTSTVGGIRNGLWGLTASGYDASHPLLEGYSIVYEASLPVDMMSHYTLRGWSFKWKWKMKKNYNVCRYDVSSALSEGYAIFSEASLPVDIMSQVHYRRDAR